MTPRIAIVLHMLSLAVLAAGGIGGMLVHRPLVAASRSGAPQLPGLVAAAIRLGIAARIGAVLMLLTGINLLWARGWIDARDPWFHIKMTLYLLVWIASLGVAGPAAEKLGRAIAQRAAGQDTSALIEKILARLSAFHLFAVAAFMAMIALAVMGP
jgi:uncharacterized membrane protein